MTSTSFCDNNMMSNTAHANYVQNSLYTFFVFNAYNEQNCPSADNTI